MLAGEKAKNTVNNWLPDDTLAALDHHLVSIKGPLTTPVGGGFRSLNVALGRSSICTRVCAPCAGSPAFPRPVKAPEDVNMIIFRENTEDIYAGIEWRAQSAEAKQVIDFLRTKWACRRSAFRTRARSASSRSREEGSKRLIRAAIDYAITHSLPSVTLVHKGNIMKYTEGGFRDWGYELAKKEYGATELDGGPWLTLPGGVVIKDVIADAFLQQILTRPREYSVIATMNLNGDYISDALAAQVGGIGIAPGANINYQSGHAIFEATHGTAPKYAGQDKVNPGS